MNKEKLCLALDTNDLNKAVELAKRLSSVIGCFKVGLELFSTAGTESVSVLRDIGYSVFLDLKLHDIPRTVACAAVQITRLGVSYLTIHAAGGETMIAQAADAVAATADKLSIPKPKLLAVTLLTSIDKKALKLLGVSVSPLDYVVKLAEMASAAGADGVVASAMEAMEIRQRCGSGFFIVTPGIRPFGADSADQRRTATPQEAIESGADMLVIGRPISGARDPLHAARDILNLIP